MSDPQPNFKRVSRSSVSDLDLSVGTPDLSTGGFSVHRRAAQPMLDLSGETSKQSPSPAIIARLRSCSNAELVVFLKHAKHSGTDLSRDVLKLIHDIAIERLVSGNDPFEAAEVSNMTMATALDRLT
jgi:hypothetical protein